MQRASFPDSPMPVAVDLTPPAPTDAELVEGLRRGDPAALTTILRRYGPALLGLATRLTGSPEDGEDVVQDVLVALPLALRRYREEGRFDAWLRRVTARAAIDRMERQVSRREVRLEEIGEPQLPVAPAHDATLADRLQLESAITALPDALRIVFVLRMVEHHTHEEIAAMLGIRRGTSEVRLHRAIRHLRQTLGDNR